MPPARTSYPLAGLVALAVALTSVLVVVQSRGEEPAVVAEVLEAVPAVDPVAVLREWDGRRATAWAAGDAHALQALYVDGATAGEADRTMLGRYAARGLHVDGLRFQRLSVRLLRHGPGLLVLRVTDRVAGATVVGRGLRVALPRDGVSTRRVTLRLVGDDWRVATVRSEKPPVSSARPRGPTARRGR